MAVDRGNRLPNNSRAPRSMADIGPTPPKKNQIAFAMAPIADYSKHF